MLNELDELIKFIQKEYKEMFEKWKASNLYSSINQKKNLVKDISSNKSILPSILNYRMFLNENNLKIKLDFDKLELKNEINSRVKAQNSIEYKINNYMTEKHENGEVPLNKCFNDLYGIRIVFQENVDYEKIKKFILKNYNKNIKCIDASKGDYIATHIYFKENNYMFQWELQIWDEKHYNSNIISHACYKQDYVKWEKENKGGEKL